MEVMCDGMFDSRFLIRRLKDVRTSVEEYIKKRSNIG